MSSSLLRLKLGLLLAEQSRVSPYVSGWFSYHSSSPIFTNSWIESRQYRSLPKIQQRSIYLVIIQENVFRICDSLICIFNIVPVDIIIKLRLWAAQWLSHRSSSVSILLVIIQIQCRTLLDLYWVWTSVLWSRKEQRMRRLLCIFSFNSSSFWLMNIRNFLIFELMDDHGLYSWSFKYIQTPSSPHFP